MYIIYKRTNIITGKSYIGQTKKTLEQRAGTNGINYLIKVNGKYKHPKLAAAIVKYGWNNFSSTILESCETQLDANKLERKYIQKYNSEICGYNCNSGGNAWGISRRRAVNMVDPKTESIIRTYPSARDAALSGEITHCKTNTYILKCCKGLALYAGKYLGRKVSWRYYNETKDEMLLRKNNINVHKNKKITRNVLLQDFNKSRFRSIVQIDPNTNKIITEFQSAAKAAKCVGLYNSSKIIECCKGKRKASAGYIWKYKN